MSIGDICTRDVVAAISTTTLVQAAHLMRDNHVGSLIVLDAAKPRRPVGIITDRDIVIKVVAEGVDARTLTVGEVVEGRVLASIQDDEPVITAFRLMRRHGIRRLPVLNRAGELCGIVTLDDLLELKSETMGDLMGALAGERKREEAHAR